MREEYEKIANLAHPSQRGRKRMSNYERSAQFAPFAALSGYDSALAETARLTERKEELTDEQIARINAELVEISKELPAKAEITYFVKDKRKSGGEYRRTAINVKYISETECALVTEDGERISFSDIKSIKRK